MKDKLCKIPYLENEIGGFVLLQLPSPQGNQLPGKSGFMREQLPTELVLLLQV